MTKATAPQIIPARASLSPSWVPPLSAICFLPRNPVTIATIEVGNHKKQQQRINDAMPEERLTMARIFFLGAFAPPSAAPPANCEPDCCGGGGGGGAEDEDITGGGGVAIGTGRACCGGGGVAMGTGRACCGGGGGGNPLVGGAGCAGREGVLPIPGGGGGIGVGGRPGTDEEDGGAPGIGGGFTPGRTGMPSITVASPLMSSRGSLIFWRSIGLPQLRHEAASSGLS